MVFTSGWIRFKDEYSLGIAKQIFKIILADGTIRSPDGLKMEFYGDEYDSLEYALLHLEGITGGFIDSVSEDDEDWFYIFKGRKWYSGEYKKVRGKSFKMTTPSMPISKDEREKIDEIIGKPMDRVS